MHSQYMLSRQSSPHIWVEWEAHWLLSEPSSSRIHSGPVRVHRDSELTLSMYRTLARLTENDTEEWLMTNGDWLKTNKLVKPLGNNTPQ